MRALLRLAPASAALLISGCLVSDTPFFNAGNAAARPLAAGDYIGCSGSTDNDEVECNPMAISVTEDGLYSFAVENDRLLVRFAALDEDDYAVQFDDSDEDGDDERYQYYWARKAGDGLRLVMIWCNDLPRALVDKLVEDGAVTTDEDYQTCTAQSASAVIVAAKSYAAGEVAKQNWVEMTPVAAAKTE
jgi:hypothetical protein